MGRLCPYSWNTAARTPSWYRTSPIYQARTQHHGAVHSNTWGIMLLSVSAKNFCKYKIYDWIYYSLRNLLYTVQGFCVNENMIHFRTLPNQEAIMIVNKPISSNVNVNKWIVAIVFLCYAVVVVLVHAWCMDWWIGTIMDCPMPGVSLENGTSNI